MKAVYGIKKCLLYLLVMIIFITTIPFLYGCSKKGQQQKKIVSNGGQEIKIAVSLADMERDGNRIIKKIMSDRQSGQGQNSQQNGTQSQQGGQQGGQGQSGQQAGLDVVPVQGGGQGTQGQQGGQGQQSGLQGQQRVNISWLDAKNDPAQQEKDLDQLINQNVKAVVLQVVDPAAGPRLVRKLAQANIRVIALETLPVNSPVDGYIASDHARTGELMARYILSAAQGRPSPLKTVILQGDKNDRVSRDITSSVLEYLRDQPQVQVVQVKEHTQGNPQQATATLEQALASANNQIDAVLATDSRMAAAAASLLKSRGLDQRVITVGVGADQQATRALAAGEHDAEIDVMPDLIAQYAFDAAVGMATTGHWQYDTQVKNEDFDVPAKVTPVRLITKSEAYLLEQRWNKMGGQQAQQGQQGQQGQQAQQSGQGQQSGSQGSGSGSGQEAQGSSGRKTTLRVTTRDGKTVEMQINGEIKKIETIDGAGAGKAGGGQSEGSGSGGGQSGGGGGQS
ncbi:D-xylose-binding periplasmic protein [Pelotomaculum propionicicum]|uniref:D-xylose-binding periplasmic protein n=1 Tax=Pelotomaculum propionicicum TaxID=258475 RepID=A0A4Y7RM96_9FIRM|nr:D-xylose-binding periplasmic protein [Pelotomaculum propionicicum]